MKLRRIREIVFVFISLILASCCAAPKPKPWTCFIKGETSPVVLRFQVSCDDGQKWCKENGGRMMVNYQTREILYYKVR